MCRTLILLVAMWPMQAKDSPVSKDAVSTEGPPRMEDLDQEMRKLPWEETQKMQQNAVGEVFDRYGWNSEEDRFARDVFLKVGSIPPWEAAQRQTAFLDAYGERYGLSSNQKRELNRLMQREAMRMTVNHFAEVAPIAMEMIKTRAAGEPFTAEQVAKWSEVLRPIAEEARESVERVSREIEKGMDDKQRALLERDLKSLLRRHRSITAQMVKWEHGEWKPEDWGLSHDPIQLGEKKAESGDADAKAAAEALALAKVQAEKDRAIQVKSAAMATGPARIAVEHEWERYVREFGDKNKFSETQKKSAQGILHELLGRAKDWRAVNGRRLEDLRARAAKATTPEARSRLTEELNAAEAPIQKMFEELQKRVDALLTAEQRRAAGGK